MSISNITGLQALNALQQANKKQHTSMQQLATGKRIVNTSDDVAGAIIAENMNTRLQGFNTVSKSTVQAVSMMQTAEDSLKTITNLLQRMRTLSLQSASSSISESNRKALQKEIDALYAEIGSIAKNAEYNGVRLLDGSRESLNVQTGINAKDSMKIGLKNADTTSLGLDGGSKTKEAGVLYTGRLQSGAKDLATTDFILNGASLTKGSAVSSEQAKGLEEIINANTAAHGVRAKAFNEVRGKSSQKGVVWEKIDIGSTTIKSATTAKQWVENVNSQMDASVARARLNADGTVTLYNTSGKAIELKKTGGSTASDASNEHLAKFGFASVKYEGFVRMENVDKSKTDVPKLELNHVSNVARGGTGQYEDWKALGMNRRTDDGKIFGYKALPKSAITNDDNLRINGVQIITKKTTSAEQAAAINAVTDKTGVTATLRTVKELTIAKPGTSGNHTVADVLGTGSTTDYKLHINGIKVELNGVKNASDLIRAINSAGAGNFRAVAKKDQKIDLIVEGGSLNIKVTHASETKELFSGIAANKDGTVTTYEANLALSHKSGDHSKIKISAKDQASASKLGLIVNEKSQEDMNNSVKTTGINILRRESVDEAIKKIDEALQTVTDMRGDLGANQNRLENKLKSITASQTQLKKSYAQIMDVDFAAATQELKKNKILAQAAQAMLAQSNVMQQQMLALIK